MYQVKEDAALPLGLRGRRLFSFPPLEATLQRALAPVKGPKARFAATPLTGTGGRCMIRAKGRKG